MILTTLILLFSVQPAQAGAPSLVCRSAGNSFVYLATDGGAKVYQGGQPTTSKGQIVDEEEHDQNEGADDSCALGRTSAQVSSTDHYKATLLVDGQRVAVRCEETSTARFDCSEEDFVN